MRDDFTVATKRVIARRVNYHCANCGRNTEYADPTDPSVARSNGVAGHIAAASPSGPRYDETMSVEKRVSAENGIWLCAICSRHIDDHPLLFPTEQLQAMKQATEFDAARDARATKSDINGLLDKIDHLVGGIHSFAIAAELEMYERSNARWFRDRLERHERQERGEDPWANTPEYLKQMREDREEDIRSQAQHDGEWERQYSLRVTEILSEASRLLGDDHPGIIEMRVWIGRLMPSNHYSVEDFSKAMLALRAALAMRM